MKHNFSYWRGIFGLVAIAILMITAFMLSAARSSNAASSEPEMCTADCADGSSGKVKQKASETAEATKEYANAKREEFRKSMQVQLDEVSGKIETLKRRATEKGANVTSEISDDLAKLEKKKRALQVQLNKVGKASDKAWTKLKHGIESAWLELKNGVKKAESEQE